MSSLGLILGTAGSIVFVISIRSVICALLRRRRQTAVEQLDWDQSTQRSESVNSTTFDTTAFATSAESDTAEDHPSHVPVPESFSSEGSSVLVLLIWSYSGGLK
jgi:hypothetical protein